MRPSDNLPLVFSLFGSSYGTPTPVLDFGVTRMLVNRLVIVFPFLCNGKKPLAGSWEATRRAANKHLRHLGRRCKACRTPPGKLNTISCYTGGLWGRPQLLCWHSWALEGLGLF